jgi:membrane-associated phospholipid phosphatase
MLRKVETAALHALRPGRTATKRLAVAASEAPRLGRLWFGLTSIAAMHPATRRAGRDGLAAWSLASTMAFALKPVTRRRRPSVVRTLGPGTSSSSLPSSHTAGAFAYATAATLRTPPAGMLLLPAAALVAWSRAASARHFPTDVAFGALLGVVAGAAVHHVLPGDDPDLRS